MSDTTVTDIMEMSAPLLDKAIESVRWCRSHMQDPGVSEKLREVQVVLAALGLTLQYAGDGQTERAEIAIGHADTRLSRYVIHSRDIGPFNASRDAGQV